MKNWGFEKIGEIYKTWPKTGSGEPEEPAFLQHATGSELDIEMTKNMLQAYEIPVFCTYPNDGDFGRIILGQAGPGADFYVPFSMLKDAQELLKADASDTSESDQEG